MRFPRLPEIGLVALSFGASAVLVRQPWIDLFFAGVLLSSLLLLARYVGSAVVRSRRARRRERDVSAIDRGEAARTAVKQERARLSSEIDRSVRRSLVRVRELIGEADVAVDSGADPRPTLVETQAESRAAMTELRRQLGLIDAEREAVYDLPASGPETFRDGLRDRSTAVGRSDVVLTLGLLVLVTTEHAVFPVPGSSWLMSSLMVLTVVARRLMPIPSALAGASILLLGVVLDAAVADGFSYPIVVGLLLWSVFERRPTAISLAAALLLFVCAVGSRYAHEPDNGPMNIVLLSIVSVGALVVGRSRRTRDRADARAEVHEADLDSAREAATSTTRRAMASELHDVVSHAVSLVAVQAGAAELAWPHDPASTRTGLRAVDETVSTALAELDAQAWGAGPAPAWDDIERTVARLREAGLVVRLTTSGRPPPPLLPVVHRLVQEALTNVLKHAEGARAYVILSSDEGYTQVEVSDDGPGPVTPMSGKGYGVAGLEDRVAAVGGRLSVGRGGDGGFTLRAVLPHESGAVPGARLP